MAPDSPTANREALAMSLGDTMIEENIKKGWKKV